MPSASGALKGAATGAGIGGTFGGPIGAGIGAGVGGLIGLFKGKKKKPADTTDPNAPENLLKSQAGDLSKTGDVLGQEGASALNPALNYFKGQLSSNPQELLAATAPERGRVIDQYDTARQAIGEFGPRGGGQIG